jgi:hypothetical protein
VLASGGKTDNEYLIALLHGRHIFNATGMALPPWEVTNFPDDWLQAILALEIDVPRKSEIINRAKGK